MLHKKINNKTSFLLFMLLITGGWQSLSAADTAEHLASDVKPIQENAGLAELIFESSEHFSDIDSASLDGLMQRIGDARVVLLGESTHGTREFYEMRARITKELIEKKGFTIIAAEADWPDASHIDYFVRGSGDGTDYGPMYRNKIFSGFPEWMWANQSVLAFTHWLKDYNQRFSSVTDAVGFYGIDIYNIFGAIRAVLDYLQHIDPKAAELAEWHYRCLLPWKEDPSLYSRVSRSQRYRVCDEDVMTVLQVLLDNEKRYSAIDKQRYFNAVQNAQMIIQGERYYRTMYDDNTASKNLRDQSMFENLLAILKHRGPASRAVVWAHNSHIGDSRATEFSTLGEINLGQLVRETFANSAYLIGFGTDHGSVTAASEWGAAARIMRVPPSHKDSVERQFHKVKADNFMLPLRNPALQLTRKKLLAVRLQRAIGVAYDPADELKKHYFHASLPLQFDEYIWFDETHAVRPLDR